MVPAFRPLAVYGRCRASGHGLLALTCAASTFVLDDATAQLWQV